MKSLEICTYYHREQVAPHVGAWIEIINQIIRSTPSLVAPHVGAWIEIYYQSGRSLVLSVAPHVGAWIEIFVNWRPAKNSMSLPMWERGLKYGTFFLCMGGGWSLPMWERGLKYFHILSAVEELVAPHVGAWIEMFLTMPPIM